ncbi:hypothetical protein FRZ59_12050 [Anseongella ginsenosidimutans]|nr:hypothetical protein FRZ59_12050 [Anseongella ginsenosidimutans]
MHGAPRHTGDLDIWIDVSKENAIRLMQVIRNFGMGSLGLTEEDFLKPGYITQIGYPPLRIDILNEIDGVTFGDARKNRQQVDMDGQTLFYIGLQDFIQNKTASGRKRDLQDIREIKGKPLKPTQNRGREGHGL